MKKIITRDKIVNKKYNSPAWKRTRQLILGRQPFCSDCGISEKIMNIDHIIEHDDDNFLFFSEKNLHTLCTYHHWKKTNFDKFIQMKQTNQKNLVVDFNKENKIFEIHKKFFGEFRKLDYCKSVADDFLSNNLSVLNAKGMSLYELFLIIRLIEQKINRFKYYNNYENWKEWFKNEIFKTL